MSTSLQTPVTSGGSTWDRFRELLQAQRAESVAQRELALAEVAQSVPDDVALARTASLHRTIEQIDAALERIDAGAYGTCAKCGAAIPEERLELRPFAKRCVSCS